MNSPYQMLGIDIGGTQIKCALVRRDGCLVTSRLEPSVDNAEALVKSLQVLIHDVAPNCTAIGISAPGIAAKDNRSISWMRGRMQSVEGLVWREQLDRDVWVLNDAHAATVAEHWIGAARDKSQVVVLTLGTGVGGGVILDGKLFQGATCRAGHLGHITLNLDGKADIVGMPGSLEDCIGNHNILLRSGGQFANTFDLLNAVKSGDQRATECWDESTRGLAVGIASLINSFDPELVVLGGGISECGDILFQSLEKYLNEYEWRPTGAAVPVVPAKLGHLAGAIGAARFAHQRSQEKMPG
jgi:glucokinase